MIFQKSFVAITVFLTFAAHAQPGDSLTVSRIVELAIKNNASLNALQKGLDAAKARTGQAKSAYFPLVGGTVSYTNLWPLEKMDLELPVPIYKDPTTGYYEVKPMEAPFQLYPANNWDLHLGAEYLIYDFGKRKRMMELSRIGEQGLEKGTDFSQKVVAYQAMVMFESLINSEQMIQAKNEDIANLRQHLDFVKKKLSTGSATKFDVLRSEVQLTNSQTDAINLANSREKQQIDFRLFLGLPEGSAVLLKGTFDSTHQEYSADSLVKAALGRRTEIDLMNVAIKALEVQQSLANLGLRPSLSAHASAGAKNGYLPDLDKLEFNTVIGGQVQVPIIDGRRSHYHALEVEARIDSIRIVLKDFRDHVRTDVLKALADVNSAYQNFNASKTNVELAGESRRIANLQYEAGAIPNLDLLDAEDKFIQTKFAQLASEYRYTLSRYALMQATGFDFSTLAGSRRK